jgi:hypothetical protein
MAALSLISERVGISRLSEHKKGRDSERLRTVDHEDRQAHREQPLRRASAGTLAEGGPGGGRTAPGAPSSASACGASDGDDFAIDVQCARNSHHYTPFVSVCSLRGKLDLKCDATALRRPPLALVQSPGGGDKKIAEMPIRRIDQWMERGLCCLLRGREFLRVWRLRPIRISLRLRRLQGSRLSQTRIGCGTLVRCLIRGDISR